MKLRVEVVRRKMLRRGFELGQTFRACGASRRSGLRLAGSNPRGRISLTRGERHRRRSRC